MDGICYRSNGIGYALDVRAYPDGTPLITSRVVPEAILLRPQSLSVFHTCMTWVDSLRWRGHPVPTLILPHVFGGRQDRLNATGDCLFTLRSMAEAVNARQFSTVALLDPHSDVTPALIHNSFVAQVPLPTEKNYVGVIAPDGGAVKRAGAMAQRIGVPLYHAWKKRDVRTGQLSGFGCEPLDPVGAYLVVDDLCDGGGTFVGLAEAIGGGASLDLYVTHGLFTQGTTKLLKYYHRIFCTDSVLGDKAGVEVLPICETLLLTTR